MSVSFEWFLSLIPHFDGQTIFSIVVGLAVSLLTFAWAYKNTVGVRQEKTRAANAELAAIVLRRIAIEREILTASQFEALRETKAYRAGVPVRSLWFFVGVLNAVLTDILENAFLDKAAKTNVLEIIEQSRETDLAHAEEPQNAQSENTVPILATVLSVVLGVSSGLVTFLGKGFPTANEIPLLDYITNTVVVLSIIAISVGGMLVLIRPLLQQRRSNKRSREISLEPDSIYSPEDYTKT